MALLLNVLLNVVILLVFLRFLMQLAGINFFNPDELAKAFNLPEDEEILMLLDIGVADKTTTPLPNHNSRKALTETVSFI